jgi:hypothetical protein
MSKSASEVLLTNEVVTPTGDEILRLTDDPSGGPLNSGMTLLDYKAYVRTFAGEFWELGDGAGNWELGDGTGDWELI